MGSGEAKKAETESDYFTSATRPSSESDKSTRMKGDESEVPSAADDGASTTAIRGEEEASKGTGSSSGAGTLTPPSSVAEQIDGVDEDSETSSKAPSATVQLSSAMAAYEVAREYQRRVDRGEVRAPTDQDRANYVNWKRNYIAWLAKKRGEEAREQTSRL
ncbi:hypothetical protein DBV05_g7317 [Lasiodiplodia theobromae]|uniref:Uncharacterized protein n=2 Tax=Lasiodiplodia theobromae TaxID=45133 RepID=A0A5N5D881_9PEZI|nr:hypothetical protein DBV05_g7317 [Lasiodiplodia theobromae]